MDKAPEASRTRLLRILAKTVPELFRAAPAETALLSVILVVQAFVPVLTIYLTRLTVDGVTALSAGESISVTLLVVWWTLTLLISVILSPIAQVLQGNVAELFTAHVNLTLMKKAETLPGLEVLEEGRFYDDLEVLQKGASHRPLNILVTLEYLLQSLVTLTGISGLLITVGWWVPVVAILGVIPLTRITLKFRELSWGATLNRTPGARAMSYETNVALSHTFAAEVRLYNLLPWLHGRYLRAFKVSHETMRRVRVQEVYGVMPRSLLSLLVGAGIFAWAIRRAAAGQISLGETVVVITGLSQLQTQVFGIVSYYGLVFEHMLYFQKYFDFLAAEPTVKNPEQPISLGSQTPHVHFQNVSFSYPDGRPALQNLTFSVRPGERVAIVGENGAGKTTLVKLLLRFYDPTEGMITVDGTDLRSLELTAWRARVSAVFQDFGRYAYTVEDNIKVADVYAQDDGKTRVAAALETSGLFPTVTALPEGLKTQLGKAFCGTELSGGQWQKLALARALYRQADILILDEPTAALDPRSEAEVYKQFVSLTEGSTALLITHRLGSVLTADRVLVLKDGRLSEQGTHTELLASGGEYAELWRLQAAQYH